MNEEEDEIDRAFNDSVKAVVERLERSQRPRKPRIRSYRANRVRFSRRDSKVPPTDSWEPKGDVAPRHDW